MSYQTFLSVFEESLAGCFSEFALIDILFKEFLHVLKMIRRQEGRDLCIHRNDLVCGLKAYDIKDLEGAFRSSRT